jgi:hypothetical protein
MLSDHRKSSVSEKHVTLIFRAKEYNKKETSSKNKVESSAFLLQTMQHYNPEGWALRMTDTFPILSGLTKWDAIISNATALS